MIMTDHLQGMSYMDVNILSNDIISLGTILRQTIGVAQLLLLCLPQLRVVTAIILHHVQEEVNKLRVVIGRDSVFSSPHNVLIFG